MELQRIQTNVTDDPIRYEITGKFIKIERVPSGNELFIRTSSGETFIGPADRSCFFKEEFSWIEITGFTPGELIELQVGYGWILDSPNPALYNEQQIVTLPPGVRFTVNGMVDKTIPGFEVTVPMTTEDQKHLLAQSADRFETFPVGLGTPPGINPQTYTLKTSGQILFSVDDFPPQAAWTGTIVVSTIMGTTPQSVPLAIYTVNDVLVSAVGVIAANGIYRIKNAAALENISFDAQAGFTSAAAIRLNVRTQS